MASLAMRWSAQVVSLLIALGSFESSPAQANAPGFANAQSAYISTFDVDQRLTLQVMLIAAGYWNSVASDSFGPRLFAAVQRFQSENGFPLDGIISKVEIDRLAAIAGPMLNLWGFRKVTHPTRQVTIWVPLGLGLTAVQNQFGVTYSDTQNRVRLDFITVPNVAISLNFVALANAVAQGGGEIHYKINKDDWFVISATTPDGADHYMRYHQDGTNVTGFSLSWFNANGNISGERIAILMSGSLWSDMTGTHYISPPALHQQQNVSRSQPTPNEIITPPVAAPSSTPPPRVSTETKVSTGTGFFVAGDGSFVTAAHVIEDCTSIKVKTDDGAVQDARLVAKDSTNDLALLKLPTGPAKFASLRIGVRLGEQVAAFGFPHTDILSTSGNFTLGNVTALTGMGDDVRYFQISAPVQSGNSGGPLLDQFGNLVGIVTAKLNALKVAMDNGDLPQNVNFAVKAAILTTFLDSNRVTYTTASGAPKALGPADIAEQAKAMSGFIACKDW